MPVETPLPEQINVLAVDAEPASLAVIADTLSSPNCKVVSAASGTEALRHILKTDFALILLAVDLQGLDGLEVATLIRQVKRSSHIPIILLTSPDMPPNPVFRGSGSGFVEYLAKPIDPAALQSRMAGFAQACGRSANAEMGKVGEDLESIIRERTASLIRANDDLRREVARRERAEDALRTARLDAEAANLAKSEFLANMSHEIRTPMNGIIGLLELVLQTRLTAEQREYLNLVRVSASSLLTIINDILDFSKIEAGSLELEGAEFSLRETIGDAMKALAFEAGRKGLELASEIEPGLPDALVGDPVRLRQIVTNLVGNAIKFTASGEVVLTARRAASGPGMALCEFIIRDTGIGIPCEKLKAVFAPFFQADTSTTRVYGGTGLGLTIATRLVEIMGGSIGVDSEVGKGSVFHFSVPFDVREEARTPPDFSGLRVLVALHRASRGAILDDLRHWGADVAEAGEGIDVVARIAAAGSRPFDLVLLDDGLPRLDAFGVAARIRLGAHRGARMVAVLSSIAARQQHAEAIERGGFLPLVKPVKQSELLSLMNRVAGNRPEPAPQPAPIMPAPAERQLDVLLVEDNAINCRLAQQVLVKAGHRVVTADNGAAALDALSRRTFDVVLMDVQMPGMDGIEATRIMRERERAAGGHVPVIALTAHAMVQHRERCLKAGMDGFLVKPIRPGDLIDAVAGIERAAQRTASPRSLRTLDRAALLERVDGDPVLLAEVLGMLGRKGTRLMAETRAALGACDVPQCARLLHTLAGMFANLAADAAAERVRRIEALAASSQWAVAESEFARLEWEMERLVVEIGAMAAESTAVMRAGEAADAPEPIDELARSNG